MTDELKHPADGPEQDITSEPAGIAADAAEETKQATDAPTAALPAETTELENEDSVADSGDGESASEEDSKFKPEPRPPAKLERLQKILAQAGVASRRHAEELITGGRVQVNGQTVTVLGTKADAGRDHIRVDGKLLHGAERLRYFVLNKPKGYVTTVTDPEGRPTVMEFFAKTGERLYPVGRLDYLSEGLLLVTNDGELANKLTKASSGVEKTYLVKVSGQPGEDAIERLRQGVVIEKGKPGEGKVSAAPARIQQVRSGDNPWYEVVLIEGRNRELRKMFSEIGHHVEKIRRVGYGPLVLDLEPGKVRELDPEEVTALRRAADGKLKPRRFKTSLMLPKEAGQSAELRAGKAAIRAGKSFQRRDAPRRDDRGEKPAFRPREQNAAERPGGWKPKREDSRGFGKTRAEGSSAKPAFGSKPAFGAKRPFVAKPRYGEKAGEAGGFKGRGSRGPGANFSRPNPAGANPSGMRPSFEGRGSRGPGDRSAASSASRSFGARPTGKPPFRGRGPERDAPRSFDRNAGPNRPPRGDRDVRSGTSPAGRSGSAPRKPFTPRDERPPARSEETRSRIEIRPVEYARDAEKPVGRPLRREGSRPSFRGAGKPGSGGPTRSNFDGGRSKPAYGSKPKSGFSSRSKPAFDLKPRSDFASKPKGAFDSKSKPAFGSKPKPAFGSKPKPFASKSRPGGSRPNTGPGGGKSRPSSRPSGKRATGKRLGRPKGSQGRKRS
jgi:23S rRNA pseudouridine2605 synthase